MSTQPGAARPSLAYPWLVVAILMVAYIFSFIDRQILSLMVGPIRRDLGISDTQMSLLMGFSFALFYTLLGIPLGRAADNLSRRGIVTVGVIVWSAMTALCGVAKTYGQMFLFRIGVGVGEAALSPAAYSMIADYFPPDRRATAMSVYSMGIFIGSGLALLLGGLVVAYVSGHGDVMLPIIGATRSWQLVFFVIGGAGIVFSLAFLFVREPPRQGTAGKASIPLSEVLAYLWLNRRTVLCHNVGFGLIALCSYGSGAWIPSFFMRVHDWTIAQVCVAYGTIVMVFGSVGILFGGWLADRWLRQGHPDAALRLGVWSALGVMTTGGLYVLIPDPTLAAIAMIPGVFCISMPFGAAPAAIQEIVPARMRGQTSAVYLFIVNIIGLGLGPTAIAVVTDKVFHDDNAVGWSMLIVGTVATLIALILLNAGRAPYRESLARLRASQAA